MLNHGFWPCSSESSTTILDLMSEALANAEDSAKGHSAGNEVSCRAAFRLATYADSLYRAVQEQISSPKWATAVAIIQDKKRQVGTSACLSSTGHDVRTGLHYYGREITTLGPDIWVASSAHKKMHTGKEGGIHL